MSQNPIKLIDPTHGYLKIFNTFNIDEIKKESITLNDMQLIPGQKTSLNNFFDEEVEFLGIHDGYMQFKVGECNDLFSEVWCNEFKKIDEKRICTSYSRGTVRDYIFKNGVWK
ncbi:hypothetical protein [Arcobacter roscoffensis]|uniref:Uncharacterized protein n=1 Tax=Arcobacter roscoffensis TaxID=2961520 RepID=A0ABY5E1R1_9BACT|nr:hypothetical protein [Arcobacter roscoffensis]UTJ05412.1 hypothetical protein NJU99_09040 [Arcobacter roscoffensis]